MANRRDTNTKAEGGNSVPLEVNANGDRWCNGYVSTLHGYVIASSYQWHSRDANTILQIIFNGRLHTRYEDKFYWPRPLVTAAKRFAAEIAAKDDARRGYWFPTALDPESTAEYDQTWEWVPTTQAALDAMPQAIPLVEDDMFTPLTAYLHELERHHNIKILELGIMRREDGTMSKATFSWIPKQWPRPATTQAPEGVSE